MTSKLRPKARAFDLSHYVQFFDLQHSFKEDGRSDILFVVAAAIVAAVDAVLFVCLPVLGLGFLFVLFVCFFLFCFFCMFLQASQHKDSLVGVHARLKKKKKMQSTSKH